MGGKAGYNLDTISVYCRGREQFQEFSLPNSELGHLWFLRDISDVYLFSVLLLYSKCES